MPNINTSQLDLSLKLGIGGHTIERNASRIFAYMGVANAVSGSTVTNVVAGNLNLVAFTTNASAIAGNNAVPQRGTDRGELYVTGLSTTTCVMSGSTETVSLASMILYSAIIAGCGLIAGAQVHILEGVTGAATSKAVVVFDVPNNTYNLSFGTGTCLASLRYERRGSVGTVYNTFFYKTWGQG